MEYSQEKEKSPEYYAYYPRLFYKYFDDIDVETVNELSEAGYCYYQSVLLMDSIIDNKNFSNIPLISVLQEETIKTLTSIFGKKSRFWEYWNLRKQEYMQAIQIEKKLQAFDNVEWKIYEDLADKKSTFGKIAIDSLYQLSNKKEENIYKLLLTSHYYFSIGFQLYDDVKDFAEDFENKQFNWAIYELQKTLDSNQLPSDVRTLNKYLYINGIATNILKKSTDAFQEAMDVLAPLNIDSEWLEVIKEMKNTISGYLDITVGYIKTLETKIKISKSQSSSSLFFNFSMVDNRTIQKGLEYIKHDFFKNHAELKHVMYLSTLEEFDNYSQIHIADTFQRAILSDCLFCVALKYKMNISEYLNTEINYLIELSNKDNVGGWSYFPSVNEIAADIDDLGQLMQLFIYANKIDYIDKYCITDIEIALNNKYNKEGGIATWIIPNESHTPKQEKQDLFNRTKWGTGPDTEVVANFVYALHLYHPETYRDVVEKAMQFICRNQEGKGFWNSRWYYGVYYGTYVCLRLLKENEETYLSNIQKALDFLISSQQGNGGFGLDNQSSDALSSALALLSLKLFLDEENINVRKAMNYLLDSQQPDGSWTGVDFIKPKASEPYKSKVLTTAWVLKSLFL
jgi:prenyltransferase beta subunit